MSQIDGGGIKYWNKIPHWNIGIKRRFGFLMRNLERRGERRDEKFERNHSLRLNKFIQRTKALQRRRLSGTTSSSFNGVHYPEVERPEKPASSPCLARRQLFPSIRRLGPNSGENGAKRRGPREEGRVERNGGGGFEILGRLAEGRNERGWMNSV